MIGRNAVARASYISATPIQIVVPIPDTLPTRAVRTLVGTALPDPIVLGAAAQTIAVTIDGTTKNITANLPASIPRATAAGILANLIHDAASTAPATPADPLFASARVDLWHDALVIVPGGLTSAITITPTGGSPFAANLGLVGAPLPGEDSALLSGSLGSPPSLSAAVPRLRLTIGAQPPLIVSVARPTTLAALADDLQAKVNAGGAPEYANARVAISGDQLLVIPGAAGMVTFDPAPGDDTTVAELQLHARFAVRVRVNGAESMDPAVVELPQ
jgi:hypothetical protein